jgi:Kef-type K+ transport system membrane component KefB
VDLNPKASNQQVNNAVKTVGQITLQAIKSIHNPMLQTIITVTSIADIPTFILIISYTIIYSNKPGASFYSFLGIMTFLIINFVVIFTLVFQIREQKSRIEATKRNLDSNYKDKE